MFWTPAFAGVTIRVDFQRFRSDYKCKMASGLSLAGGEGFVEADFPEAAFAEHLEARVIIGFLMAEKDLGAVLSDSPYEAFIT